MIRSAFLVTSLLITLPLHATTYTLEPDYTQGVMRWDHLGFSSPAAQFAQGTGTVEFDPAHPEHDSVQVTIPLSTLSTGVPALDDDFRSKDFFETAAFPTATFQSTRVQRKGSADHLQVTGELNLHGVTKPVMLEVRVVKIGTNPRTGLPTVGFAASTKLRRSEFGLGRYVPQVGDEVQLQIISQAVESQAYADYLKAKAARDAAKAARDPAKAPSPASQ